MRWLVLLAGCYAPNTPSGAYRCSSADSACPSGQHCVCGLCVNQDQDAACGFTLSANKSSVAEHESFSVDISATQQSGGAAGGFNDTVSLSFVLPDGSAWCDVTPSTVQLKGGTATVNVTLNRETIPPQKPKLRAVFAGNKGDSNGIEVTAPAFTKDQMPIVPTATVLKPFGWADTFAAEPAIIKDASGYRMYFLGFSTRGQSGIGIATSTDGVSFTATKMPVWQPAANTWYSGSVQGPAPFFSKMGISLAFTGSDQLPSAMPNGQIGVATSTDGMSFNVGNGGQPVIRHTDCDYCMQGVDFADVLDEPANLASDMLGGKIMFFSSNNSAKTAVIGRASSSDDGATFAPEPAPVLQGELGGEAILISPHVLVDGSVFKMWYSFATLRDAIAAASDFCKTPIHIGYATSTDGFYWVRSPSNLDKPALSAMGGGLWEANVNGFVAGTALPTDGMDPSKGISLYYSTVRHLDETNPMSPCVANGIGRATRM